MHPGSQNCCKEWDGSRRSAAGSSRTRSRKLKAGFGCLADDSHSIYVAESPHGEIAGYGPVHWLPYLFMAGPEGYVSELFVRDDARGQGVGRQLLRIIEVDARARGCQRLSLINLRNRESYQRQFYLKAGWRERSEAANFVSCDFLLFALR